MSGPFFDRFDIRVYCSDSELTLRSVRGEKILKRVNEALKFKKNLGPIDFESGAKGLFESDLGSKSLNLRARGIVHRLSMTLAYLDLCPSIRKSHIDEALELHQFKSPDGFL